MSPLVAYLAHEECSVSGNVYSVAGGRVARIVVAETHGVVLAETLVPLLESASVAIAFEDIVLDDGLLRRRD